MAEAEVYEAAAASQQEAWSNVPPSKTAERSKQYVLTQATLVTSSFEPPQDIETQRPCEQEHVSVKVNKENKNTHFATNTFFPNPTYEQYNPANTYHPDSTSWSHKVSASTNYNAMPFQQEPRDNDNSSVNDFIRYFARREIVATGLVQFNDKPQNFRAWERSFNNAIRGLDLTASEEMDFVLKWLGKESAEHAEQIRAIHINNPVAGLEMIWDRLEQCYGSAEAIEDALFKRLDSFSKITTKDYIKLRKFSDLLLEMQCAKAEGDLLDSHSWTQPGE